MATRPARQALVKRPVLPQGVELVILDRDGSFLCTRCAVAARTSQRLRGLMGRRLLTAGDGLLLPSTWSIHTAFLRFPLDVVFLNRVFEVLAVVRSLRPWRVAARRGAWATLELPAGTAAAHDVRVGDRLGWAAATSGPPGRTGTTGPPRAPEGRPSRPI
jgi:uncharacterized membrane protein (UPF0127 family)